MQESNLHNMTGMGMIKSMRKFYLYMFASQNTAAAAGDDSFALCLWTPFCWAMIEQISF